MKKLLPLLILSLFVFSACKKCESLEAKSQLMGIDFRKCASPFCGGWFIEIEGDTLRFFETPAKTDVDLNGELDFPVPVKVKWKKYENDWKNVEDLIFVEELWKD